MKPIFKICKLAENQLDFKGNIDFTKVPAEI